MSEFKLKLGIIGGTGKIKLLFLKIINFYQNK